MKKLLVPALFVLLFFSFVPSASAQLTSLNPTTVNSNDNSVNTNINNISSGNQAEDQGTPNRSATNYRVVTDSLTSGYCLAVASDQCLGNGAKGQSALESTSKAIAFLYTPQASTGVFLADLARTAGFNIAQPAYAQGIGFSALDPILSTWKILRNMAYIFYVVIFLVIGFMMMFRRKIGAHTIVTIQEALPNIIVSLIAVTFSYAIAGLLIDVMYLAMFLLVAIFQAQVPGLKGMAIDKNIFQIAGDLITSNQVGTFNTVQGSIQNIVNSFMPGAIANVLGWFAGLLFAVIFAFALLFAMFRLFFELLKTYVGIIIAIVLSPLALMMGALPGSTAFQTWLKLLIAHLAVFPTVLLVLILSLTLRANIDVNNSGGFLPPYLIGQGNASAIAALVSMGMLLVVTEVVQEVKNLGGKGGVIEQLINSSVTNFWEGRLGLPVVGGAIGGVVGAGTAVQQIRAEKITNPIAIRQAFLRGEGIKSGGVTPGAETGFNIGRSMGEFMERISEGRLLQFENVETQLSDFIRGRDREKRAKEMQEKRAKRPVDEA